LVIKLINHGEHLTNEGIRKFLTASNSKKQPVVATNDVTGEIK
jgi:hypothetical protein